MGRAPCCDKANVKKGPWSPDEDSKLKQFIEKYGTCGNWIALPQKAGLKRCGKSCRLRWLNYLRPNIKHGEFSDHEDKIICTLFATIGSRWSVIAAQLPGRTDNDIKNYWNTKLKKKLMIASSSKMVVPFPHHHHQPLPLLQSLSLHHQTTLSPSPPSTYYFTDSTKPNLELSNPLNNTSIITCPNFPLQVIQESLLVPKTHHQYTPHMMGSDQTSCSNSSDGSSTSNQFSFNGDHYQQMGSIIFEGNYFNNSGLSSNHEDHQHQIIDFGEDYGFSSHDDHERQNGLWGELTSSTSSNHHNHLHNDHYSTIEEIKQLVSSTTNSSNSNNFFMYY